MPPVRSTCSEGRGVSIAAAFLKLDQLISALITTRILGNHVSAIGAIEPAALAALPGLDLGQRLAVVRNTVSGRIVFTTSWMSGARAKVSR